LEARLDGKVALVTGSTQGIGGAIAELAVRSGAAAILVTGRDAKRGADTVAKLTGLGAKAAFVAAELSDPATPARLVGECVQRFGRIDILVNAAANTDRASVLDASLDDWSRIFETNTRAPLFLMQAAIRAMRKQGEGGGIVNILSMNAHGGTPELAVYSASKAALSILTRNAASSHRRDRIRVNGINVGWVPTPAEHVMQAKTLGKGADWAEKAAASLPFGRLLQPEEVANLAVFMLSEASGVMTGALVDQEQWVVGARE
jgi:NAD(P)-dependent dehydrogenase (short-subunit alcohol dehydrogenase family)